MASGATIQRRRREATERRDDLCVWAGWLRLDGRAVPGWQAAAHVAAEAAVETEGREDGAGGGPAEGISRSCDTCWPCWVAAGGAGTECKALGAMATLARLERNEVRFFAASAPLGSTAVVIRKRVHFNVSQPEPATRRAAQEERPALQATRRAGLTNYSQESSLRYTCP